MWAASIMLTAYCTVPSADDTGQSIIPAPAPPAKHVSPWALPAKN